MTSFPDYNGDPVEANCRSCGAEIYFVKRHGKWSPINRKKLKIFFRRGNEWLCIEAHESHFSTCPQADKWRKNKPQKQAELPLKVDTKDTNSSKRAKSVPQAV